MTFRGCAFAALVVLFVPSACPAQAGPPASARLTYAVPRDAAAAAEQAILLPRKLFSDFLAFTDAFNLPFSLTEYVGPCRSDVRTEYDDAAHRIIMCTQDADDVFHLYTKSGNSIERSRKFVRAAMSFAFLHELGHALIDDIPLRTTGSQEDAADEFATVFLASYPQIREDAVDAAYWFRYRHQRLAPPSEWDEHSDDARRSAHIMCLVYGNSPDTFAALVNRLSITTRAKRLCPYYFRRQLWVWRSFLDGRGNRSVFDLPVAH